MTRRYANAAFIYAVAAMVCGVFYREFTKFQHFEGRTNLAFMHAHYFMLGMFFFLLLMLAEKMFAFSDQKTKTALILYHAGLNIAEVGFLMRGLAQVLGAEPDRGLDASISGIAGIGHILLGIGIILLLLKIKKRRFNALEM